MYFQALVLTALALEGALAQPAHQNAHRHKQMHAELARRDWDKCNIDNYKGAPWYEEAKRKGTPVAGCPATSGDAPPVVEKVAQKEESTSSASAQPSGGSSSTSNGDIEGTTGDDTEGTTGGTGECSSLEDVYTDRDDTNNVGPWAGDSTCLNKRATVAEVGNPGYVGGSCYGSNIKPQPGCKVTGRYGLTMINKMGSDKKFWVWNKVGPSGAQGDVSGMMNRAFYQFTLKNGQSAVFNIDKGSIIGFSQAYGRAKGHGMVPSTSIGEVTYFCDPNQVANCKGGSYYDTSLVTVNQAAADGTKAIPMAIYAGDYSLSSTKLCNFYKDTQDHPDDSSCTLGPMNDDGKPFHVVATFGSDDDPRK